MGTFGSRTTPTMWPQMRKAAAAAREMLIDLAAEKWSVARASISVANGRLTAAAHSANFGELTNGQTLTKSIPSSLALEARHRMARCRNITGQGKWARDRHRRA